MADDSLIQGRITNVTEHQAMTELAVAATAGDVTLAVANVTELDGNGGTLGIGAETITYTVDDETGVVSLLAPLAFSYAVEEPIWVLPLTYERIAWVIEPDQEEELPVQVPHALWDKIPVGVRAPEQDDAGERVDCGFQGNEFVILDLVGQQPVIDGSYIDPYTADPTIVLDGTPPASSPTPNVLGAIGALAVTWAAISNRDPVTYELHMSNVSGFTPTTGTKIAELGGTTVWVRTQAGGSALVLGDIYYLKTIAKDGDGAAAPSAQGAGSIAALPTGMITSDGHAPSSSPTPTVTGGPTFLSARWTPVTNADPVTYEVHVSTTTGFTPNPGTKYAETPGSSIIINRTAAGSALAYGTTYFVKTIAKDFDGSAAASSQASAAMVQIDGVIDVTPDSITAASIANNAITPAELAALAVTAGKIAANGVTSGNIDTDVVTAREIIAGAVGVSELAANSVIAGKIAAGAVTAQKLTIGSFDNIVADGGFEVGGAPDWTLTSAAVGTTTPRSGLNCLSVTAVSKQYSNLVTCAVGDKFYAEVYARRTGGSAATTARIAVRWLNSAGAEISSSTGTTVALSTTYAQLTVGGTGSEVTAPANTTWMQVTLEVQATDATNVLFDDVYGRKKVSGQLVVDGSIVATNILSDTITANQIATDAITTAELAANAVIAENISAHAATFNKLTISSTDNVVVDNGFEVGGSGSPPAPPAADYTLTAAASVSTTTPRSGLNCLAVTAVSKQYSNAFTAAAGDKFYAEVWARRTLGSAATTARVCLRWLNASGAEISSFVGPTVAMATTYTQLTVGDSTPTGGSPGTEATAPASTASAQITLEVVALDGTNVLFDDVYGRRKVAGQLVVDGTIVGQHMVSDTITSREIVGHDLSAIYADLGTITAGTITLVGSPAYIRSGATDPMIMFDATGVFVTNASAVKEVFLTTTGLNLQTSTSPTSPTTARAIDWVRSSGTPTNVATIYGSDNGTDSYAHIFSYARSTGASVIDLYALDHTSSRLANFTLTGVDDGSGYGAISLAAGASSKTLLANNTAGSVFYSDFIMRDNLGVAADLTTLGALNSGTTSASGTSIGDKIALFSSTYGFGIQLGELVAFYPAASKFAFRATQVGAGNKSSGPEVASVDGSGIVLGRAFKAGGNGTSGLTGGAGFCGLTDSGANQIHFDWSSGVLHIFIDSTKVTSFNAGSGLTGTSTKSFVIDHPLADELFLVHACLEGPEDGVYYRGHARCRDGRAKVILPDYFEALTFDEDRTVQVTPTFGGDEPLSPLAASRIENGSFLVRTATNLNPDQEFDWIVHAKRQTIEVEPPKALTKVRGDGPYTYVVD